MDPTPSQAELSEALAAQWVHAQPVLTAYITSLVGDLSIAEDFVKKQRAAIQHRLSFSSGLARSIARIAELVEGEEGQ